MKGLGALLVGPVATKKVLYEQKRVKVFQNINPAYKKKKTFQNDLDDISFLEEDRNAEDKMDEARTKPYMKIDLLSPWQEKMNSDDEGADKNSQIIKIHGDFSNSN